MLLKNVTLIALLTFASCSSKELAPDDAEGFFIQAREFYDDGNYEIGVQKLEEFQARFPYSKWATEADLLTAHALYELGNYEEAAGRYKNFVEFRPNHPEAEFASYRIGASYWELAPSAADREQLSTEEALGAWSKYKQKFPHGKYVEEIKKKTIEGRLRLAQALQLASNFYCRRDVWHACAYLSLQLVEEFQDFPDLRKEAAVSAREALQELLKLSEVDPPEGTENWYTHKLGRSGIEKKLAEIPKL